MVWFRWVCSSFPTVAAAAAAAASSSGGGRSSERSSSSMLECANRDGVCDCLGAGGAECLLSLVCVQACVGD